MFESISKQQIKLFVIYVFESTRSDSSVNEENNS